MKYFPINLDISDKKVLVVGGGQVARRKAKTLLSCGARVTVVSPAFCRELKRMKKLKLVKRNYRKSDIGSARLVVSATDSQETNQRVYKDALSAKIPVNVVDQPNLCTFTVPAVVNIQDLMITISTGGSSPALAKRIRKKIEKEISPDYATHLALLSEFRPLVQSTPLGVGARMRLLNRMADKKVHNILKKKGAKATRQLLRNMLSSSTHDKKNHT